MARKMLPSRPLITGTGSSIGRAAAQRLAQSATNQDIVVLTDQDARSLAETGAKLGNERILSVPTSVSNADQIADLFVRVEETSAALTKVVHATGNHSVGSALNATIDEWDRGFSVNATRT